LHINPLKFCTELQKFKPKLQSVTQKSTQQTPTKIDNCTTTEKTNLQWLIKRFGAPQHKKRKRTKSANKQKRGAGKPIKNDHCIKEGVFAGNF
jgi:hypothetical protein